MAVAVPWKGSLIELPDDRWPLHSFHTDASVPDWGVRHARWQSGHYGEGDPGPCSACIHTNRALPTTPVDYDAAIHRLRAREVQRIHATSDRAGVYPANIDHDGTRYWNADPGLRRTFHAGKANGASLGIGICQGAKKMGNAKVWAFRDLVTRQAIDSALDLVEELRGPLGNKDGGPIVFLLGNKPVKWARLLPLLAGRVIDAFGHCHVSAKRFDPDDDVWKRASARGWVGVTIEEAERMAFPRLEPDATPHEGDLQAFLEWDYGDRVGTLSLIWWDLLQLGRAVTGESSGAAKTQDIRLDRLVWSWLGRFGHAEAGLAPARAVRYDYLGELVQAHSQPINVAKFGTNGTACEPGGSHHGQPACSDQKREKREWRARLTEAELVRGWPGLLDAIGEIVTGVRPRPPECQGLVDFRSAATKKPGMATFSGDGNAYDYADPGEDRGVVDSLTVRAA